MWKGIFIARVRPVVLRHGDLLVAPALLIRLVERLGVDPLDELLDQLLHLLGEGIPVFFRAGLQVFRKPVYGYVVFPYRYFPHVSFNK